MQPRHNPPKSEQTLNTDKATIIQVKPSWSKRLFIASDILLAIYLVFVFTSFDRKNESKTMCSKVNIEIADDATSGFIDTKVAESRCLSYRQAHEHHKCKSHRGYVAHQSVCQDR